MITVRTFTQEDHATPESPDEPVIRMTISGRADLQKLQALLNRSLNCAPEFGQEWFELSDRLNDFLAARGVRR